MYVTVSFEVVFKQTNTNETDLLTEANDLNHENYKHFYTFIFLYLYFCKINK